MSSHSRWRFWRVGQNEVPNGNQKAPTHHASPSGGEPSTPDDTSVIKGAWRDLFFFTDRSDAPVLLLSTISSIAASVPTPAQAFLIGKIFNEFVDYAAGLISRDELRSREQRWVLYLTCLAIATVFFHSLEFTTWMLVGERQARRARQQLYDTLSRKSISWFDMQKQGIAALLPRLEAQIADMQLASAQPFGGLITSIFTAVISLGEAFYMSWSLTLVTLATSPLIVVIMGLFGSGIQAAFDRQHMNLSEAQKVSLDALISIDSTKYFNTQDTELTKYRDKVLAAAGHYVVVSNKTALQMGCLTFLVQAMFVQAFYYGSVLISRGEKTSAEVVTAFFSAIAAFQAVQGVLPQIIVLEKGRSSAAMLKSILLERPGSADSVDGQLRPLQCSGAIRLCGVSFTYPTHADRQAISNVSTSFRPGQLTFVVGRSGSGKSTIGQLLVRFYEPEQGQLFLDGVDYNALDTKWLRSKITLVEQASTLFDDSILANIKLGQGYAQQRGQADIQTAIDFALLQALASDLPNGLDTLFGSGGALLSGGQCQRVALARARLRDTPVLVLDESTSALDKISRDLIMDAIRQWRHGKTTIVITHEIDQILENDYAIVLENGHLVQEGFRNEMEELRDSPFGQFISHGQDKTDLEQTGMLVKQAIKTSPTATSLHSQKRAKIADQSLRRFPATLSAAHIRFPGIPISLATLTLSPESCRDSLGSSYDRDYHSSPYAAAPEIKSTPSTTKHSEDPPDDRRFSFLRLEDHLLKIGTLATSNRKPRKFRNRLVLVDNTTSPSGNVMMSSVSKQPVSASGSRSIMTILSTAWPILPWQSRIYLLLGFWGGTVHGVCSPVFAYILANLMALAAVKEEHSRQSMIYSLAILSLAIIDGIHFYLCRFMLDRAAQAWVDQSRIEALRRLLSQPRAYFDKSEIKVLPIVQDLDRSGEEMRNLLGRFAGLLYIAGVIVISSVIWALVTQWKVTLIALATVPYVFVTTYFFSKGSEYLEALSKQASAAVSLGFEETFRNIRVVRALLLEAHFQKRFSNAVNKAMQIGRQRAAQTGMLYGIAESSSAFSIAFVFYIGAKLVSDGADVMSVVQVFIILIFAITNVTAVLGYVPQVGSAKLTANRILDIANIDDKSHENAGDVRLTSFGNVEFNQVTFAYPTRPQTSALKNVTFTIERGRSIAIVGGSGSGKSTIAKLILKLYETPHTDTAEHLHTSGIRIAGRYVQDIETASLRSVIAVVSQSNPIFPGTIAENITYGLPEGSPYVQDSNVALAASQAGILDFINSLPAGLRTRIGDGGKCLSGGQAQRVAIARALVRHPHALILDEATSALDVESAATIRATIAKLVQSAAGSMTVIIITHAKEMMELAEQIVVLDNGCLVQRGPYELLISQPGPLLHLLSSGVWNAAPEAEEDDLG